jgi:rSAM/selenodomain-associated transferase 1
MNENAVILFTRIPIPGQCKTRMIPSLGAEITCALQRAFIADIAAEIYKTETSCDVVVCFEPSGDPKTLETLITGDAVYIPQRGSGLGERMDNALSETFSLGYRKVVLLGSDLPLIEAMTIDNAFASLDGCDCVLLPTIDGGYGLIGVKEPDASLFDLCYGGSSVAEETRNAIARGGKTCALLPPTLDVDDMDDLIRLRSALFTEASNACPETRKMFAAVLHEFLT